MDNEAEIRNILLKVLELQQKQYEQHQASAALYRELAARQKKVLAGAGCLLLLVIVILGAIWILIAALFNVGPA
ncbi:MAG TPA: hypothetical protein VHC22_12255 [Pirellulales bacterium]|nr:hypothetical protein [Pirellulales bacterium]